MMKRMIGVLVAFAVAFVLTSSVYAQKSPPGGKEVVTVVEQNAKGTVDLKWDGTLVVKLASSGNQKTGWWWLKGDNKYVMTPNKEGQFANGMQTFTFKPLNPGKDQIWLQYKKQGDTKIAKEVKFWVSVGKKVLPATPLKVPNQ